MVGYVRSMDGYVEGFGARIEGDVGVTGMGGWGDG
jgi:hypothetical protein